ncbi:MAG: hypothetical protein PQJ59_08110 [Spirochaetales bacterium]|nr:hypothetical protein [Spirochaetales bacterium]
MIQLSNTQNLTGVTISGDYYDLTQLADALQEITISELGEVDAESRHFINISHRIFNIYDEIRNTALGYEAIDTLPNGIGEQHQAALHQIIPRENIYYSCNILYPEMIVLHIALDELIELRTYKKREGHYHFESIMDQEISWDKTIATIRMFQSSFRDLIAETLTPMSFSRWHDLVHKKVRIHRITNPFIDMCNQEYMASPREERAKRIVPLTNKLLDFEEDRENENYRLAIEKVRLETHCHVYNVVFKELEYPEDIEW